MDYRPTEESMIPFLDELSKKWHVKVKHEGMTVEIRTTRQTVLYQIIDRAAEYEHAQITKRGSIYTIKIKDKQPTIRISKVKKDTVGRMRK